MWPGQTSVSFGQILILSVPLVHNLSLANTTQVWQNATLVLMCANKCFVLPNSEFEFSTCAQLKFGKTQLKFGKTQLKFGKTKLKFGKTKLKFGKTQLKLGKTQLKFKMSQLKFAHIKTKVWRFPNHR